MRKDHLTERNQDLDLADEAQGYCRPPKGSRFKKGVSGNPAGRPKGSKNKQLPYEDVLGREVTIRQDSEERVVTTAEALLLKLAEIALKKGGGVAHQLADLLQVRRKSEETAEHDWPTDFIAQFISSGSVNSALVDLRMGWLRDPFRSSAKIFLEPWIVEQALDRLGDRRLTVQEQMEVLKATRTPTKVKWPNWWQALPEKVAKDA